MLKEDFPYPPTPGQEKVLQGLVSYLLEDKGPALYLLKGYAGTGKTTLISALVKTILKTKKGFQLLAPTGRAAKVLASYSGQPAFTIHKKIYRILTGSDGRVHLGLNPNRHNETVFFVDEASMIPDTSGGEGLFSESILLDDLMHFVHSGKRNKLVLIGDTAQLPPVGLDISPALDLAYLKSRYSMTLHSGTLTEVVRQELESGILINATNIRNNLHKSGFQSLISTQKHRDVEQITGEMLEEKLNQVFYGDDLGKAIVVTRSNKRANIFNREIRNRVLYRENEISSGDLLMVVRNNYFWMDKTTNPGFIANGDIVEIIKVIGYQDLYGFRFADVIVHFQDYQEMPDLELKIMLDSLMAEGPSISQNQYRSLFDEVMKDYEEEPSRRKRIDAVRNNPFFNALQVKFAYALTCHKTQGGQWEEVFIDPGYLKDEHVNTGFYRWLYTAFTRATKKLYLINFPEPLLK